MQHTAFRKGCINIAQKLHSWDVKLRMSLLGQNTTKVRPLNDRKAIEDGATFLAEGFVFSVGSLIILYEAYKANKKQKIRTEAIEDDIKALQDEIEYLKNKLSEAYLLKLDDYQLPKDLKPKVLGQKLKGAISEDESFDISETTKKELESLEQKYSVLIAADKINANSKNNKENASKNTTLSSDTSILEDKCEQTLQNSSKGSPSDSKS